MKIWLILRYPKSLRWDFLELMFGACEHPLPANLLLLNLGRVLEPCIGYQAYAQVSLRRMDVSTSVVGLLQDEERQEW